MQDISDAVKHRQGRFPRWDRFTAHVLDWMNACSERSRQRRILARLSDEGLRDIGVSRRQADCEADKVFWRR